MKYHYEYHRTINGSEAAAQRAISERPPKFFLLKNARATTFQKQIGFTKSYLTYMVDAEILRIPVVSGLAEMWALSYCFDRRRRAEVISGTRSPGDSSPDGAGI
jgi:hypothetical protein